MGAGGTPEGSGGAAANRGAPASGRRGAGAASMELLAADGNLLSK